MGRMNVGEGPWVRGPYSTRLWCWAVLGASSKQSSSVRVDGDRVSCFGGVARQTDPEAAAAVAGPAAGGDAGRRQDQALAADASHRSGGGTAAGPEAALDGDGEDTPLFGHRRSAAAGNDDAAAAEETADFMGFSTHGSAGGSALGALARGDAGRPCSPANSDGDAAARRGGGGGRKGRGGGGNASDGEDASLQVQGRSMDAFTSLEAVGRPKWLDRFRVDDEDDLYGTGSAVDSMPARVYGNYIHIGGGPPTPDAPGSPDLNNADVTDAYDEAAVLDVIRATVGAAVLVLRGVGGTAPARWLVQHAGVRGHELR